MAQPEPRPPAPAPTAKIVLAFAAVYLLWGSTYLAMRVGVRTLPPFLLATGRFLTAGLVLVGWSLARAPVRPTRAQWRQAALAGIPMLVGGNGGVVWAVQRVPSGLAALMVSTVPLWIVLLEWARGGRRPRAGVLVGVAAGLVGIAVLVGPGAIARADRAVVDPIAMGVLLLASLSWAAGTLIARASHVPGAPLLMTGMQMVAGGVALLALSALTGELGQLGQRRVSPAALVALCYLVVCGSLVAYTAYVWLLRVVPAARVATYAFVNPVVAILLGWIVADEPLAARTLYAAAIILGAVVLITTASARKS